MAYFSDILGPDEKLEATKIYPMAIVVPADMSDDQFEAGLTRALLGWYDFEKSPLPNAKVMHIGFGRLNPYELGDEPAETWDLTPRLIEQSLSFKTGVVAVKVDRNYLTGSEAFSKGFVTGRVFQTILDYFTSGEADPIRWLSQDATVGPNATHVVWILWQGTLPAKDIVEAELSKYNITNLWGRFSKVPIYTEKGSAIIEMWLAFGDQALKVSDLQKILGAQELRVATVPRGGSTETTLEVALDSVADVVYGIVSSTWNVTMAASDIANALSDFVREQTKDREQLKTYLKIGGAIGLGIIAIWGTTQVVSWFRTGQTPSLPWRGRGGGRTRAPKASSSKSTAIVKA